MFYRTKTTKKRFMAGFIAVLLLLGGIPIGNFITAFAATISSYTVQLTDESGNEVVPIDGVEITITNQSDEEKKQTEKTDKGVATFLDFLEEGETYTVHISDVTGYDAVVDFEITPISGDSNTMIIFTANGDILTADTVAPVVVINPLDRWTNADEVTISGSVTDENTTEHPSAGLAHIVWSKENPLSEDEVLAEMQNKIILGAEGQYSFTPDVANEQYSTYYIYAVDHANNVSEAASIDIGIDRSAPSITGFAYSVDGLGSADGIGFFRFGTFYKNNLYVTVTAKDKEQEGDISSGIKEIILYVDGEEFGKETIGENGNSATFLLNEDKFRGGAEIAAIVKDNAGNSSGEVKPTTAGVTTNADSNRVQINQAPPALEIVTAEAQYTDGEGKQWYNENTAFAIKAKDENTGIKKVEATLNTTKETHTQDMEGNQFSEMLTTNAAVTVVTSQEGKNALEATVENNAGSRMTQTKEVYIDTTKPVIEEFDISLEDPNILEKAFHALSFGTFANAKVNVTVTASDVSGSGVKSITLYADGEELETQTVQEGKCIFKIPANDVTDGKLHFNKTLSATAEDNVGNAIEKENAEAPTDANSNIKSSGLMIETIAPGLDIGCVEDGRIKFESTNDKNNTKIWYDGDVKFQIAASDENSGVRNVVVSINGTELVRDNLYLKDSKALKAPDDKEYYEVSTEGITAKEDGSYTLVAKVTDNAGNVKEETRTIYKDTTAPHITGFDFAPSEYIEGSETASTVEATNYGFYFKTDTKVTISAKDEGASAGIKSISYYIVDKDTGKGQQSTANVTAEGKIEFTVKANFKGQIYARATDNVNNAPEKFVNPNGTIVESAEKHGKEGHIAFAKEATTLRTADNEELYAKDVPVTIIVSDTYSGIREIEWSLTSPYDTGNNQEGMVTLYNDRTVTAESEKDWVQTKWDRNLVTEMQKIVTVRNNSNHIRLFVRMTDRSGNTSEREIYFSIDKTSPVIEIAYDNNTADAEYTDIYAADRTATIMITERNFHNAGVVCNITNTDGVIPVLSAWEEHRNENDPDATYYTAIISYTADGDYTFNISYADLAGNAANVIGQHSFTIDKTIPIVSVSYDNQQSLNGNYYRANRTATITITEHNFDATRVNIIGTATDNDAPSNFPEASNWTSVGDVHTATIRYINDSRYSFDLEFLDMAGNSMAEYVPEEFYVDKTAPTIEISGVSDKSANQGVVAPVIIYTDTNFNRDNVSISLSGVNNGIVDYSSSREDITNGLRLTYENFDETDQKVDDIYTLTATLTDMAGNETTQTISFSANRFGSVYNLSNVSKINGKYLKAEEDIVFEEVNVDELTQDSIKLKLVKNEEPSDLVEGKDYTVDISGGNGQWSVYKYTIGKKLFADDGKYQVMAYSVDAAGNINENIEETKKAEIVFAVDKTKPRIIPIDFESGVQYPVEEKEVSVEIKDNLVLEEAKIYLNDNEISYRTEGEQYLFNIPESNKKQTVRVTALDAAGNEQEVIVEDFLVSTNVFVRWYNNTPLFVGTIIGIVGLGIGVTVLTLFFRRRKTVKQ